jgi:membrane protein YdbS with pleckstrin-like domain
MGATMFENPEIAIENLPGTETLQWQELDPRYKRLRQVQSALALLVVAAPLLFITIAAEFDLLRAAVVWSAWTVVLAILLTWPIIAFPKRGYVVRDKDILFRKGIVWRSVTAVPFNRIQHVETSNTPLDRKFGLATLQLFTAGGSSGDLKIDGIEASVAEQLRIYILRKTGTSIEHAE